MVKNKKQSSLAEKTEQILLTMPRMIATQIGKDLLIQSQQEKKLNFELKKCQIQGKKLSDKVVFLKKKNTAVSKKQAAVAQKALQKNQQVLAGLVRALAVLKNQKQSLSKKKAMYTALQAQLVSFKKEWDKKVISKVKKRPKAVKVSEKPQQTQVLEIIQTPKQEEAEYAQEESMEKVS